MFLSTSLLLLLISLSAVSIAGGGGGDTDLYARLGVSKDASMREIKTAYRQKARDTHPDKQKDKDPEVAAKEFREIVDAYETLSDDESRRIYDQTGKAGGEGAQQQQQQPQWQWGGFSSFHFNFGHQQRKTSSGGNIHHLFFHPYRQLEIKDAWNRVLNIRSLKHLQSVLYKDAFDDDDDASPTSSRTTERYCILAFYDPRSTGCTDRMQYEILYPWPFAGNSAEVSHAESMWWEEIMLAGKVDVSTSEGRKLAEAFGVVFNSKGRMNRSNCPLISFIPRGSSLDNISDLPAASFFPDSDAFRIWVWKQLKMTVDFVNKTKWPVHYWWLDGMQGKRQPDLEPGKSIRAYTFISHSFFFRAGHVTGNTLTNESALLWYTARIQDDLKTISIEERCFDLSGECARWRQEGFCDRSTPTFYTNANPGHYDYVLRACPVSCKFGCGKPDTSGDDDRGRQRKEEL